MGDLYLLQLNRVIGNDLDMIYVSGPGMAVPPWWPTPITYGTNHANIHVRGYKQEGTSTTPDMTVLNLDRFHLVMDAMHRLPQLSHRGLELKRTLEHKLVEHTRYIREHGEYLPPDSQLEMGGERGLRPRGALDAGAP